MILESDNGSVDWAVDKVGWPPDKIGNKPALHSIFGTSDGKHLWAVGDGGTILKLNSGSYQLDRRPCAPLGPRGRAMPPPLKIHSISEARRGYNCGQKYPRHIERRKL
jgi:hypothetical protein